MQEDLNIQYWIERVALFNDTAAFEKLFFHFNDDLHRIALRFVKSADAAEDIISETFTNLWRNRARLTEIENFRLYLFVTVKNLAIKYLSRERPDNMISLEHIITENFAANTELPDEQLISKELAKSIAMAIHELPPKCKLIFTLIREHGLKYKEVATLLSISVKTIDAQMAIASKRIAQSIKLTLR